MKIFYITVFSVLFIHSAYAEPNRDQALDEMLLAIKMVEICSLTLNETTERWTSSMTSHASASEIENASQKAAAKLMTGEGGSVSIRQCWSVRDYLHGQGWL